MQYDKPVDRVYDVILTKEPVEAQPQNAYPFWRQDGDSPCRLTLAESERVMLVSQTRKYLTGCSEKEVLAMLAGEAGITIRTPKTVDREGQVYHIGLLPAYAVGAVQSSLRFATVH